MLIESGMRGGREQGIMLAAVVGVNGGVQKACGVGEEVRSICFVVVLGIPWTNISHRARDFQILLEMQRECEQ